MNRTTSEHFFWKVEGGEVPAPRAARVLGWKALEVKQGSGRVQIEFTASEAFTNSQGYIQAEVAQIKRLNRVHRVESGA